MGWGMKRAPADARVAPVARSKERPGGPNLLRSYNFLPAELVAEVRFELTASSL